MKESQLVPRAHLYVCVNRRADGDPLGGGCRERGEVVFTALKSAAVRRGLGATVWVAKTGCLGLCPKTGCTVGISPGPRYLLEVEVGDADAILDAVGWRPASE